MKVIEEHNNKGTETYTMGENLFTDMTQEEWYNQYARPLPPKGETKPTETFYSETFIGDVNWVTKGKTPPVLNQGQCGSCWTFSTMESVDAFAGIKTGTVGSFAEQQLVDCDRADGNNGCSGGWPHAALDYLAQAGICTSASYPYTAQDGTC